MKWYVKWLLHSDTIAKQLSIFFSHSLLLILLLHLLWIPCLTHPPLLSSSVMNNTPLSNNILQLSSPPHLHLPFFPTTTSSPNTTTFSLYSPKRPKRISIPPLATTSYAGFLHFPTSTVSLLSPLFLPLTTSTGSSAEEAFRGKINHGGLKK